jgi:hypothetical protein
MQIAGNALPDIRRAYQDAVVKDIALCAFVIDTNYKAGEYLLAIVKALELGIDNAPDKATKDHIYDTAVEAITQMIADIDPDPACSPGQMSEIVSVAVFILDFKTAKRAMGIWHRYCVELGEFDIADSKAIIEVFSDCGEDTLRIITVSKGFATSLIPVQDIDNAVEAWKRRSRPYTN